MGTASTAMVVLIVPPWFKVIVDPNWELFLNLSACFQGGAWRALEITQGQTGCFIRIDLFQADIVNVVVVAEKLGQLR